MQVSVYIDPKINLNGDEMVAIIVQFTTNPAHTQVASSMGSITLDEAAHLVEASHLRFQQDLWRYLDKQRHPYIVTNQYQDAFNGVAMGIRGKDIHSLLQSDEIGAIYLNQKTSVPVKPNDSKYQL